MHSRVFKVDIVDNDEFFGCGRCVQVVGSVGMSEQRYPQMNFEK